MSHMKARAIEKMNREGPLSMSEADLAALEERHEAMKQARILVRQHLTHCEHGDAKTLFAFDMLMQYIGIHEDDKLITQPKDY